MEKTVTLNLRVNPTVKRQAEDVLRNLGIPMSTAIDVYLRQISMVGGIPFPIALPKAPASLNADSMSVEELRAQIQAGYDDMQAGKVQDASKAFTLFREDHQ